MKTKILLYIFLITSYAVTAKSNPPTLPYLNGFTENQGQITHENGDQVAEVLYSYSAESMNVFITTSGISYVFWDSPEVSKQVRSDNSKFSTDVNYNRTDMNLKDARIAKENIITSEPLPSTKSIYYNASNIQGITGIRTYKKITVQDVYPGIDWVLYTDESNQYTIKYDFVVKPGANPDDIKLVYEGANVALGEDGNQINIVTDFGAVREGNLFTYQSNKKDVVPSGYLLRDNEVRFEIGAYNADEILTIDPPVIIWSTNYGGTSTDYYIDSTVDEEDNLYIHGKTRSTTLPGIIGNGTNMGQYDIFVVKFDTHGALLWSVMFGGAGNDDSEGGIAVSQNGEKIYFTGTVPSADYPILEVGGAYNQSTFEGGNTGFISKIDNEGTLLWSTFIGGSSYDHIRDIAINNNDEIFIMGFSSSNDFPVVEKSGAYNQASSNGGINEGILLQLDSNDQLDWSTYFGGDGTDQMSAMKFSPNGNLIIIGNTDSRNFPIVEKLGAYNSDVFDTSDEAQAVIMEFDQGNSLLWSTLFGGTGYEQARIMQWDELGNFYVVGETESPDMPVMELPGAYFSGELNNPVDFYLTDAFIVRFDLDSNIDWSTYYGGDKADLATAIEFDEQGNMWLGGATASQDFPLLELEGAFNQSTILPGVRVMFWTVFDVAKELKWSTLYGGDDFGWNSGFQKRSNGRMLTFTQASSTEGLASGIFSEDPLAYTQEGITSNDLVIIEFRTDDFTMGVNSDLFNDNSFTLYPNPSRGGKISIRSNDVIKEVKVVNIAGQVVAEFAFNNENVQLNLSGIETGIYILSIKTDLGTINKKVVLSK